MAFIGVQAFIASQAGLKLGTKLSEKSREGAEKLAGVALIIVALILIAIKLSGHQI
jgi:putative Mn2+ efflux pump MntP